MWIHRFISDKIRRQAGIKPVILLTGARQTGKSSLLKHLFGQASYLTLDRPLLAEEAETSPESFLKKYLTPLIIDEIQYAPKLFRELKIVIDEKREIPSQYLLTGSQRFQIMKGVTESLAGRISVFELDSLSAQELREQKIDPSAIVQRGGYPELWVKPDQSTQQFFNDYIITYLERDLPALIKVDSVRTFDRFLRSVALRVGSLINYSSIASDIGVSPNTVKSWVNALVAGGIVYIVEPYFNNRNKRLIKSPKLYFRDNGLLCHLLQIHSVDTWKDHALGGKVWENFVFTELLRELNCTGSAKQLFFWQEKSKLEIDFLVEESQSVVLIECKLNERAGNTAHFDSFARSHPKIKATRKVACLTPEPRVQTSSGVELINPIYSCILGK